MALTNFITNVTTITAAWLNKVDVLLDTIFDQATTKEDARTALGVYSTAEVDALDSANDTALANHLADTTDAHDASAISTVAAGNLSSTNVQNALNELDSEKIHATVLASTANAGVGSQCNPASVTPSGGNETRPRNVYVMYCIKY